MEPRFNLFDSPPAAKVAKRFYNASLALEQSTLPKTLQELVNLRVSQINGCGLCVAEEGTRLADDQPGVSDETWAQVRKHYDDDQVGALVCLVSMINAANRMNVIVNTLGGSYEPGMLAALDLA